MAFVFVPLSNELTFTGQHSSRLDPSWIESSLVSVSATVLDFGSAAQGSTSFAQTITVTNNGTAPLTVNSVTSDGPFSAVNNLPATLAPGASGTVVVSFKPTSEGNSAGGIYISTGADSTGLLFVSCVGKGLDTSAVAQAS